MSVTDFGGLRAHDATSGIGYGVGAGSTVTQQTDKGTGVTINAASGQITLNNAALTTAPVAGFVVTNSAVAATDTVVVNAVGNNVTNYVVGVGKVAAGSFTVFVQNISGNSRSDALVVNFAVINGSSS